jgi:molecular chaperone GrpE
MKTQVSNKMKKKGESLQKTKADSSQIQPKQKDKQEETDYKTSYLRALADYQNLLKRVEKERRDFVAYANEKLLTQFLTILDDLERAQTSLNDEGLALIITNAKKILEQEGVEEIPIKPEDEFNPNLMECIEAPENGNKLEVVRKGYTFKGRVIRPAQIRVIKT